MITKINVVTPRKAQNAKQIEKADKFALKMMPSIDELKEAELTIHGMAAALNRRGLRTPRGNFWSYQSVFNVLARLDAIAIQAKDGAVANDEFYSPPERLQAR